MNYDFGTPPGGLRPAWNNCKCGVLKWLASLGIEPRHKDVSVAHPAHEAKTWLGKVMYQPGKRVTTAARLLANFKRRLH